MDRPVKRFGMVVDVEKCVGCYNCMLACRDEHAGNDHLPLSAAQPATGGSWVSLKQQERGSFPKVKVSHVPSLCVHCEEAPCIRAGGGAVYRRPDGIVIIDPARAAGRRDLARLCPYGTISWNEERNLPQKCTFCAHLLDQGWKEPRCVEACPSAALVFGDLDDPASDVSKLASDELSADARPELRLKPAVRYSGLPRRFIAGEVAFADRLEEPAVGVTVILRRGSQEHAVTTDAFGDFEFQGLDEAADYVLSVAHAGYDACELPARSGTDPNVGTIVLAHTPS
jgi:Fe-S-cluster-containing dehydrogenase component